MGIAFKAGFDQFIYTDKKVEEVKTKLTSLELSTTVAYEVNKVALPQIHNDLQSVKQGQQSMQQELQSIHKQLDVNDLQSMKHGNNLLSMRKGLKSMNTQLNALVLASAAGKSAKARRKFRLRS